MATLVIEFLSFYAPQRIEVFGGKGHIALLPLIHSSGGGPSQPAVSFHHSIFNHVKTIYISPSVIVSNKPQRLKVDLALEVFDIHHFYRLLLFPSMNKTNPHRICELISVYLIFESLPSTTDPSSPLSGSLNRSTLKSLFHRHQKIHIGLNPLSSAVLTALFPSDHKRGDDDTAELSPRIIESLISKWMTRHNEQRNERSRNNFNLLEVHLTEMDWLSRSITMIQRMCISPEPEVGIGTVNERGTERTRKRIQRDGPYMLSSISKMRERLIQVRSLSQF
jgi:hypothetical protein